MHRTFLLWLSAALIVCILMAGCDRREPVPFETSAPAELRRETVPELTALPTVSPTESPDPARAILAQMSLREMVGQLFVVRPDALNFDCPPDDIENSGLPGVTECSASFLAALNDYPVGGFAMFSKNIESPEQISAFNADLLHLLPVPMFLAVDEEGGTVARLANTPGFDLPQYAGAGAVGETQDPGNALEMGRTIGAYLRDFGFNLDFAPVADINTNPDNPVIGSRAFSSSPESAAQMASAMAQGLREQGIIPTFKHFPGHGDTSEDSHEGLAFSRKSEQELMACEWRPFQGAGPEDLVMAGHIALPCVLESDVPASMSRYVVTDILKGTLGFSGLVITDSLSMGAVTQLCTSREAALKALQAGCDLLLMPYDLRDAFDGVVQAVDSGAYPEDALRETVLRILHFKLDRLS